MIVNRLSSTTIEVQVISDSGSPVVPLSMAWTLTDPNGAVINNRLNVTLTPALTMYVVLNDNDLPFYEAPLTLYISGTYSSVHGTLNVNKTQLIHIK